MSRGFQTLAVRRKHLLNTPQRLNQLGQPELRAIKRNDQSVKTPSKHTFFLSKEE